MNTRRMWLVSTMIIMGLWMFPEISWSQLPAVVKRSNELTRQGINLVRENNRAQAEQKLLQAVRLNPKNVLAHEMLALIYYQERNFDKAIQQAKLAQSFDKRAPRALYVLGLVNFQQGNRELARTQLKQALTSLKEPEYRERAKNALTTLGEKIKPAKERLVGTETQVPEQPEPAGIQESGYKPYIAVFPFQDTNARTAQTKLGQTLTEMLITALIQTEKFTVMERVQLEKILAEQALSQTGVIDAETAVEVGKLSGLEGVVMGSISQLRTTIEGDARLIDVETGKALVAANAKVNNVDDLRELASHLTKQLAAKSHLMTPESDTTRIKTLPRQLQQ